MKEKQKLITDIKKICKMPEKKAIEELDTLIKTGKSINFSSGMTTPLGLAVIENKPNLVKFMLENGASTTTPLTDDDNEFYSRHLENDMLIYCLDNNINKKIIKIILSHLKQNKPNYKMSENATLHTNFNTDWLIILNKYDIKLAPATHLSTISKILFNYKKENHQIIEDYLLQQTSLLPELNKSLKYHIHPMIIKEAKQINCAEELFQQCTYQINQDDAIETTNRIIKDSIFDYGNEKKPNNYNPYLPILKYLFNFCSKQVPFDALENVLKQSYPKGKNDVKYNILKSFVEKEYLRIEAEIEQAKNQQYKKSKL